MAVKPSTEIYIDELILNGFAFSDRYLIAAALEAELIRLISQGEIPSVFTQEVNIPTLNAGSVSFSADVPANRLGSQLAKALYSTLGAYKPYSGHASPAYQEGAVPAAFNPHGQYESQDHLSPASLSNTK